ncbi:MAG: peptidoglycan-binding protein [Candidatus Pacebacteria bacterium]|nr:peptidoglycan-binding protein [Candidatus Paceibacterota bacterium]
MTGSDVQCLQDTLVAKGYLSYGNYSPAFFDVRTWNAVVSFQSNHGLGRDGIVGYMTRTALFR